jgi:hypothetical protein
LLIDKKIRIEIPKPDSFVHNYSRCAFIYGLQDGLYTKFLNFNAPGTCAYTWPAAYILQTKTMLPIALEKQPLLREIKENLLTNAYNTFVFENYY